MFIVPTPIFFLEWQVWFYGKRIAEAKSIEERIFLKKEHYRLKQQLQAYLN